MRQRVTIERYSATRDAYGAEDRTWAELLSRRCSVTTNTAKELLSSDREAFSQGAVFRLRYDNGTSTITTDDRLLYNGVYWDIKSVDNVMGMNHQLVIYAEKGDYGY